MKRPFATLARLLLLGAALTTVSPAYAGVLTCSAILDIVVTPGTPTDFGDVRTVTLSMGSGMIVGGTQVTLSQVRYDLDCDADFPLTVPCADQGDIFNYQGDGTITSNCGTCDGSSLNPGAACSPAGVGGGCDLALNGDNLGTCQAVTWTSNVPGGGNATNEIVFTPSSPLVILANMFPVCDLSFDVQLDNLEDYMGPDSDLTPMDAEVVAGFSGTDAVCDNTLNSEPSVPAFIPLAPLPICGDSMLDPGETCDPPSQIPALPPGNINECRADCTYCGDGLLQEPETCDTGGLPNRACELNCTGRIAKDPASITFNVHRTTIDRLQVNGLIIPPLPIDPSAGIVGVKLTNVNGLIYQTELAAGDMVPFGVKYKFRNRAAKTEGGFSDFQFFPHREGYRIKLSTYGDLSAATLAEMTVEVYFGTKQFVHSATWDKTKRGWREVDHE